ncbi:Hypothetical predicted protein [Lecanosticta acicola]|uniref:Uncharacterized protein n=1 Tax=Lecanosticta acicola TaxID=111012 RepID=A0AAI9EBN9_9PEZI|nr:Hypothetical predicted protein [Lecanosticta acicola]
MSKRAHVRKRWSSRVSTWNVFKRNSTRRRRRRRINDWSKRFKGALGLALSAKAEIRRLTRPTQQQHTQLQEVRAELKRAKEATKGDEEAAEGDGGLKRKLGSVNAETEESKRTLEVQMKEYEPEIDYRDQRTKRRERGLEILHSEKDHLEDYKEQLEDEVKSHERIVKAVRLAAKRNAAHNWQGLGTG